MAKEKTIKRIGVVIEGGNIMETDTNGKSLKENTKWFGLNDMDLFIPTGVTAYDASSQHKVFALSTSPEIVKLIARSGCEHAFYIDDSMVSDEEAISTATANTK